jgi:hypothetical protein
MVHDGFIIRKREPGPRGGESAGQPRSKVEGLRPAQRQAIIGLHYAANGKSKELRDTAEGLLERIREGLES